MTMDERKNAIRDLEDRKQADIEARNQLLENLGETLFRRIGDGNPFSDLESQEGGGENPGAILGEYRRLQKEIADSAGIIKGLEEDIIKLKELEGKIFTREEERSRLEKELEEVYTRLGKALLSASGLGTPTDWNEVKGASPLEELLSRSSSISRIERLP